MNTAYKFVRLLDLDRIVKQLVTLSDQEIRTQSERAFWGSISDLINWGLVTKTIDYAYVDWIENDICFYVPTANLWAFYNEICRDLEGLPFAFNNISRKTFTRRLLRNKNYERKKVRYRQKVVVGVGWRVSRIFLLFFQ
jgi:hypothetical protein